MGNKARAQNTGEKMQNTECLKLEKGNKFAFYLSVLFALFSFLCFSPALSSAQDRKEPTVITSRTLITDSKAKTALFEGAVVAKKGEMTLFADKMLVHYSEQKGESNIKQIDAEGNVKLLKGERVITSSTATYFAAPEEKVIFAGAPRASEGENLVTGTRMTYFTKDEHFVVESSKVFLVDKK